MTDRHLIGSVPRMRRLTALLPVWAIITASLVAGCTSEPTREAAASDSCPDVSSFTLKRKVTNQLPFPIVLSASEWICNDWSGMSTPGRAFNNLVIQPGESKTVTLEPAMRTTRNWTLTVKEEGASGELGKMRMSIPQAGLTQSTVSVEGASPEGFSEITASKVDRCEVLKLARTDFPDTPGANWRWYFTDDLIAFVVRDGYVSSLTQCVVYGA
jgi:hypothetical protein